MVAHSHLEAKVITRAGNYTVQSTTSDEELFIHQGPREEFAARMRQHRASLGDWRKLGIAHDESDNWAHMAEAMPPATFIAMDSFAGLHDEKEPKELRLFDVVLFKRGLMPARRFIQTFGDLPYAAQVIYKGNMNKQFIEDVRMGLYPVDEGVIAKGDDWMVKIKTYAYLKRLNEKFGADYRNYWE